MPYSTAPASEEPIDLGTLKSLAGKYHYGFSWSGPEPECDKGCQLASCGLVEVIALKCQAHPITMIAAAKQTHRKDRCPG